MVYPRLCFCLLLSLFYSPAWSQDTDTSRYDPMPEVVVRAYEQGRRLRDFPAAINVISRQALERFSPASIVLAVSSTPGVRMEERSPGSYRLNVRGSALRSPFGVRNVKVYFNDLPITDPGGHTYLNQLGYYNFGSLQIIKGPGSSLYGAGTGGVMLIEGMSENEQPSIFAEYAGGSFGLRNIYGSVATGNDRSVSKLGFQHQKSEGYRRHSGLQRDVLTWNGRFRFTDRQELRTTFLYSNLFYETPGALTQAEFDADPRSARPAGGGFPSAEQSRASITQKTVLAGASYRQAFGSHWENRTSVYGMFTELRNPTIRNYARSAEPHVGGRTVFQLDRPLRAGRFQWHTGLELQQGYPSVTVHKNAAGEPDSVRTYDEIQNNLLFAFTQVSVDAEPWTATAGVSWNKLKVGLQRFQPGTQGKLSRDFNSELAPRLSVGYKWKSLLFYTSVSRGYSPPTTAELTPSGNAINLALDPEEGMNYDLGIKAAFANGLYLDVNAFLFYLNNTIVQRRDAGGGDFYQNAGNTRQQGIETYLSFPLLQTSSRMRSSLLWLSHTWHRFRYRDFKQVTTDYSGNRLPGTAPHTLAGGFDWFLKAGFLGNLTYLYTGRQPLNDANTVYAPSYHLLGVKLGMERIWQKVARVKVFAGADNLLDQRYSLGNDINGFGGRFFNAAPGRNYYAALVLQWFYK